MTWGKRGGAELVRQAVLLAALGILVTMSILSVTETLSNPYIIDSLYVAKDTAMLLNTFNSIPYDIHYEYPKPIHGKFFTINENKVTVIHSFNETGKSLPLQHYLFNQRKNVTIQAPAEIDTSLFAINKKGNEIRFETGMNATQPLTKEEEQQLIESEIYNKEDLVLYIDYSAPRTEQQHFKQLDTILENQLRNEQINITTLRENATLVLEIIATEANTSFAYYSQENSQETQPLLESIVLVLPEELNFINVVSETTEYTIKPTLYLLLSKPAQTFLHQDENKRYTARRITAAIQTYY